MAKKKATTSQDTASTRRRRRKPGAAESSGLAATELQTGSMPANVTALQDRLRKDGGDVLSTYREPFGGQWIILAGLPIHRVAPTPYQRNLSDAHVRKLEHVIARLGYFLDPIIAVPADDSASGDIRYWTPNGHHRLCAMRNLGAHSITALVIPDPSIAYRILALNTEKAHTLREKALEVIRMYRELAAVSHDTEQHYQTEFEEPALITLGLCYEQRPRFSGGAYHPVLKRVETFLDLPLAKALAVRLAYAQRVLALDDVVNEKVEALKQRGVTSPYLKTIVVAHINPLRAGAKGATPRSLDHLLDRMLANARTFRPETVKPEDLVRAGGPVEEPADS